MGGVGGKGREIPFLILELERPCVVQAIVFGKYHKRESVFPSVDVMLTVYTLQSIRAICRNSPSTEE